MIKMNRIAAAVCAGLMLTATAAQAITFSTSVGTQPGDVGVITITDVGADSVKVLVDLKSTTYGFINTGGPHTPFAFNISGSEAGLSISSWTQPVNGSYGAVPYLFTLNPAGGSNTPYGTYGVALDSSAPNGSGTAYYGDLEFTLTRTGGLRVGDFVANSGNWWFSADLTDGKNTGAQGWYTSDTPPPDQPVPEPGTLALLGFGLLGLGASRRRVK